MSKLPLLLLACLPGIVLAQGKHAHSHGAGQLEIVVDQTQLVLQLEVPQHDLTGFERSPKTAREQVTVQAALEKLRAAEKLFAPTPAAQCALAEQSVDAPLLTGAKDAAGGHGDVVARYVYRCAKPEALNGLKSMVSAEFQRVRSLNVSFAGPKGQKAGKVDAKNPGFAW